MIVRIDKQQVAERKAGRLSRDIKAGSYLKAVESSKLEPVRVLMRNNKGVIL